MTRYLFREVEILKKNILSLSTITGTVAAFHTVAAVAQCKR
jgi:hypothetical protein